MIDYKETLLMPKTAFEMRGNLGQREPGFQEAWKNNEIYEKRLKENEGKPTFLLHDGPPYANGDIHIGHALNKTLKDFIIRYKNMNGFYAPYIPGWDTHGLPIETAITKKGINRKEKSPLEFRLLCEEYAYEQVNKQKAGFLRMGVLGDFDHPYLTLQHDFEKSQILVFAEMAKKGLIYKGLKPVYWSPTSESALAEAEIEYYDVKSSSIFVALKVLNGTEDLKDANLVIWTTTPWTIPGNLAVAVGKDIHYSLVQANGQKYILASDLVEANMKEFGFEEYSIIKEYTGPQLEGLTYKHPFYDRISSVVVGHHVTTSDGTGLVHIAPGFGEDDFIIGKKYGLPIYCPVDSKGIMQDDKYKGMFYEKGNDMVVEDLANMGILLKLKYIVHSYPHDWRTKKPIIFRATPQWFASIDPVKEDLLKEIHNVKWYPKWGETRISNMIADRKEWCISRQRVWGVPIPAFYAEDGTPILDYEVIKHIADLFGQYGSNVWFEREAKDLLPEGYTNEHSPNGIFTKETDTMDVWFDSGSSHQLLERRGYQYPADLYLEGSDQYRGWFNSSLITGVSVFGKSPYKQVVTHGFVLDGQGRKMSKSLGNTVDPIKMANKYGADILRLWVSNVEYNSDVRISEDLIKQCSEAYRKIRNTFKFLLGALSDFNPEKDMVSYDQMPGVDQYMMMKLSKLTDTVLNAYENYNFQEIYRSSIQYITNVLSAFYLDFTKDILYIEQKDSMRRRSVQSVIYHNCYDLMRLLTPIIPHTMSEAYSMLPGATKEDVYLCDMPKNNLTWNEDLFNSWESFMKYRDTILKALEDARNEKIIGKSMNAVLRITPSKEEYALLEKLKAPLAQILIVSRVELLPINDENPHIEVLEAKGCTCSRCWQIVDSVNDRELCPRCEKIVKEFYHEA